MTIDLPAIGLSVEKLLRFVARDVILPCFRNLTPDQIRYKKLSDAVTDIDEQAEALLSQELQKLIPGSYVVGEESCYRDPSCLQHLKADYSWLVDPLDGTNNFVKHQDDFGIIIALLHRGKAIGGWIYLPVTDVILSGIKGGEVERNGSLVEPVEDDFEREFSQMCGLYRLRDKSMVERIKQFPLRYDTHCNAFDFGLLLSGDADFIVYPGSNAWDIVAGALLVEMAGGYAARSDGRRLEGNVLTESGSFLAVRNKDDWKRLARALF